MSKPLVSYLQCDEAPALKILGRLFERATQQILLVNQNSGSIELANHAACMSLGYTRDGLLCKNLTDICPDLLGSELEEIIDTVTKTATYTEVMASFRRRVGTLYPVELRFEPLDESDTSLIAVFVNDRTATDLSAHHKQIAAEVGRHCFSSMNLDSWELQRDPALDEMYGFPDFDAQRTAGAFLDCVLPEHREEVSEQFIALAMGQIDRIDHRFPILTKDGKRKWIHGIGQISDYDPRMVVGMQTEITDEAEQRIKDELRDRRLSKIQGQLADRDKEMRDLLETIPDSVSRAKPDTTLIYVNQHYCDFLGKPSAEIVGRSFFDFIPEEGQAIVRSALRSLTPENPMVTFEQPMGDPEGDWWYLWSNLMLYDTAGNPSEIVSVGRDISELVRARRDIAENNAALAGKNRVLEQFSRTVAHDLKLPIRNIEHLARSMSGDMKDGRVDRAISSAAEIAAITTSMTDLIDGLLQYSEIAYSEASMEKVDLREVAGDAKRLLWTALSDSGAELEYADLPVVDGNHELLVRLFQNLISNSIKYRKDDTPPKIGISAKVVGDCVEVAVSDNGTGIDPSSEEWVFGMFQRLHKDNVVVAGKGIGLTLARQIANKHGGDLQLDTDYRYGARFVVKLPRRKRELSKVK